MTGNRSAFEVLKQAGSTQVRHAHLHASVHHHKLGQGRCTGRACSLLSKSSLAKPAGKNTRDSGEAAAAQSAHRLTAPVSALQAQSRAALAKRRLQPLFPHTDPLECSLPRQTLYLVTVHQLRTGISFANKVVKVLCSQRTGNIN